MLHFISSGAHSRNLQAIVVFCKRNRLTRTREIKRTYSSRNKPLSRVGTIERFFLQFSVASIWFRVIPTNFERLSESRTVPFNINGTILFDGGKCCPWFWTNMSGFIMYGFWLLNIFVRFRRKFRLLNFERLSALTVWNWPKATHNKREMLFLSESFLILL